MAILSFAILALTLNLWNFDLNMCSEQRTREVDAFLQRIRRA